MSEKLRIGVAGAGVFGAYHAAKYASHDSAKLVGVYDIDQTRAKSFADRFEARSFESIKSLLGEIDAIVIATPASTHFELVRDALNANRHVFVEKPLALSPEEADELILLANENGLVLQVGHQERYVFDATGLLSQESAPLKIDCVRYATPNGRCEDVSVVLDLMVHDLDLVRQLTRAELQHVRSTGVADEASAELTLDNGSIVNLKASRKAKLLERRMTLVYPDGVVEFDFVKRQMTNSTPMNLHADFSGAAAPLAFSDPLAYGANQFIQSVLTGRDPIVTGLDGRMAVDWAQKIEDAAGFRVDTLSEPRERLTA